MVVPPQMLSTVASISNLFRAMNPISPGAIYSLPPRRSVDGRALPHAFWKRTQRQQLLAKVWPPLPLLALAVLLVCDKWCQLLVASLLLPVLGSWLLVLLLVLPAWLVAEGW